MQLLDTHPCCGSAPAGVQSLAAAACCATSFASLDARGTVRLYDTRLRKRNYLTVDAVAAERRNNRHDSNNNDDASELVYLADRHLALVLQGCAVHVVDVRQHMRVVDRYVHDSEFACVLRSSGATATDTSAAITVTPPAGASQAVLIDDAGRVLVFDALTAAPTTHVAAYVFGRAVELRDAHGLGTLADMCGGCCVVTTSGHYNKNDSNNDNNNDDALQQQCLFVVDMSGNGVVYDAALQPRQHFRLDDDGSDSSGGGGQATLVNPPVVTCCSASSNMVATGRGNGMYDVLTVGSNRDNDDADATAVQVLLSAPGHAMNGLCYVDWCTHGQLLTLSLCGEVTMWDVGAFLTCSDDDEDDDALPAVRAAHHHRDAAACTATVNCAARLASAAASYVVGDTAGNITLLTL